MATTTPPPTAAISRAIPSGMLPLKLRKWSSTLVEFCSMKTMRRTKSRSAAAVATQAALARVRAGAPGADGELAPRGADVVDCSADSDVGGSLAMIPTFLSAPQAVNDQASVPPAGIARRHAPSRDGWR
jgi:hypothetical protein